MFESKFTWYYVGTHQDFRSEAGDPREDVVLIDALTVKEPQDQFHRRAVLFDEAYNQMTYDPNYPWLDTPAGTALMDGRIVKLIERVNPLAVKVHVHADSGLVLFGRNQGIDESAYIRLRTDYLALANRNFADKGFKEVPSPRSIREVITVVSPLRF